MKEDKTNIIKTELTEHDSNSVRIASYMPLYDDGKIQIWNDKFEGVLPQLKTKPNIIITDPPYPDYYEEEYQYYDGIVDFLTNLSCKQLIFWTSKMDFPLDYTAIHIWDKRTGCGSEYERIFERNGQKNYKVFSHYLINSTVAASYSGDIFTGHKSQKPIKLMMELVKKFTDEGDIILDPFMGSGSTLLAAKKLNRRAIGIEVNPKWCEVAVKRLNQFELFD